MAGELPDDVAAIVQAVAAKHGLSVDEVMAYSRSPRRKAYVARREAMRLIRGELIGKRPRYTLEQIAAWFGVGHPAVHKAVS